MLSVVYAVVVCLSVYLCVSVTFGYCIKMDKLRITQIMPHDRSGTLSFQVRCFVVAGLVKCLVRSLCNSRASCIKTHRLPTCRLKTVGLLYQN